EGFTGVAKVQASMRLGTAHGCKKDIAPSIQRKFRMAAKLSFPMQRVSPRTADRVWSVVKPRACAGWAKTHPHFMAVRILTPGTNESAKLVATKNPEALPTNTAIAARTR